MTDNVPASTVTVRLRRFLFRTRGVWLLLALAGTLYLKHVLGIRVAPVQYFVALSIVIMAQVYRTWAAGFVGSTARGAEVTGETLITAGPYAYLRNPMYLGILAIMMGFALMSGMWISLAILLATYALVYFNVIPYEEDYLSRQFGAEYEQYFRSVPRLWPKPKGYSPRQGVFLLREGLKNETASIPGVVVFASLFYFL